MKPKKPPVVQSILVRSLDRDHIETTYASRLEGWAELPVETRTAMVERTMWVNAQPVPPTMCLTNEGGVAPHPSENATNYALGMTETFGNQSLDLAGARLSEIANWFFNESQGPARGVEQDLNAGIAFVHGMKPQTPVEATLATQMVMTNSAALRILAQADRSVHLDEKNVLMNQANKLLRTFTAQAEALAKIQRGGEQVVKHVHVDNRGGQAIITETVTTGGQKLNGPEQSYGTEVAGSIAALPGQNPLGDAVPITRDARAAKVSASWGRKPRPAKG